MRVGNEINFNFSSVPSANITFPLKHKTFNKGGGKHLGDYEVQSHLGATALFKLPRKLNRKEQYYISKHTGTCINNTPCWLSFLSLVKLII